MLGTQSLRINIALTSQESRLQGIGRHVFLVLCTLPLVWVINCLAQECQSSSRDCSHERKTFKGMLNRFTVTLTANRMQRVMTILFYRLEVIVFSWFLVFLEKIVSRIAKETSTSRRLKLLPRFLLLKLFLEHSQRQETNEGEKFATEN